MFVFAFSCSTTVLNLSNETRIRKYIFVLLQIYHLLCFRNSHNVVILVETFFFWSNIRDPKLDSKWASDLYKKHSYEIQSGPFKWDYLNIFSNCDDAKNILHAWPNVNGIERPITDENFFFKVINVFSHTIIYLFFCIMYLVKKYI